MVLRWSGDLERAEKRTSLPLNVGDIVLCKIHGAEYLHFVKAIQDGRFQIGSNKGRINGWIGSNGIYGVCVRVED